jgi:peptidoglycan/LPS O-acetylase OafA/YrhL
MVEGAQRSKSRNETSLIWITVLYSIFLISMIVLDDMGKLYFLVRLVHSFPYGDKFVHFFLIGALSFLVNTTMMKLSQRQSSKRISIIVTVILLVIFTIEEASQMAIPGRKATFFDLAASFAGILTFALLAYKTRKKTEETLLAKSAE